MAKHRVSENGRSLRVLVVDDEAPQLELARERLEGEGHHVTTLGAAAGIQTLVTALGPDIVLMDVLMPDLTGRDLMSLLQNFPASGSPAVILHSSIPVRGLSYAIDPTNALGVIQKTSDDVQFFFAFNGLIDRLAPAVSGSYGPAYSGTHRIEEDGPTEIDIIPVNRFARTSPGRR